MKISDWRWIKGLPKLLATSAVDPVRQAERIVAMQLHIVLPARIGVIGVMLYYLYDSGYFAESQTVHFMVVENLLTYFFIYVLCNLIAAVLFSVWKRFPAGLFQWVAFGLGLLDGYFVAGLTFLTEGFESMAFWLFPGLIVLNAASIPLATPQFVLNFLLSVLYFSAGILEARFPVPVLQDPRITRSAARVEQTSSRTNLAAAATSTNEPRRPRTSVEGKLPFENQPKELAPFMPQMFVLWLMTASCYGVQVLAERQRRMLEEAREFAMLEGQLRSAGRLAAEVAHQLKNPLGIINNAVFSLQRSLKDGKASAADQIRIIQEEIARADRILTDLMGYAQLNEGRVEKLNVSEELDRALEQTFPQAAGYRIQVKRDYAPEIPPLLMQRRHLSEIFLNVLQNAREAMNGQGTILVTARCLKSYAIEVTIRDDGPGVPAEKLSHIFEAYYSTKEKGTGLGLAIVKHSMELYGGTARVESALGKGACFTLLFPGKTVISLAKPK